MALPKENRLRHRQDFKAVYQKGGRHTGSHLTLRSLRQRGVENHAVPGRQPKLLNPSKPTRIGISISQKVSKKAVIRNRIKRQIRAAFRQMLPRILSGWLVVVVVRPAACECDYVEILRELDQLLVEAEVIDGH